MTDEDAEKYLCSQETADDIRCQVAKDAFSMSPEDQQDLQQICFLHLWIVLRRNYDPARSTPRTFISRCIRTCIKDYFRRIYRVKRRVELNTVPIPEDYLKD